MELPKMRTVTEIIQLIVKEDPDSAITQHFIRKLCADNKIKHFNTGKKLLINYDNLLLFLSGCYGEFSVD